MALTGKWQRHTAQTFSSNSTARHQCALSAFQCNFRLCRKCVVCLLIAFKRVVFLHDDKAEMIWGTTRFKVYASQLGNRMLHTVLPAHVGHWQQISKPEPHPKWEPVDEERGHSWAIPKTSAGLCSGSPPLRLKCEVESVHCRTHMLCWTGYLLLPLVDKLLCAVRSLGNLKRTLRSKRTLLLTLHLPIWIYSTFMNLFALDCWSSSVKCNSVTTDFMNRCLLQRQAVLRCPFDQFQEFQASRATSTHAFCYLFIHHTSVNPWEEVLAGSPHDWSMTPGCVKSNFFFFFSVQEDHRELHTNTEAPSVWDPVRALCPDCFWASSERTGSNTTAQNSL